MGIVTLGTNPRQAGEWVLVDLGGPWKIPFKVGDVLDSTHFTGPYLLPTGPGTGVAINGMYTYTFKDLATQTLCWQQAQPADGRRSEGNFGPWAA